MIQFIFGNNGSGKTRQILNMLEADAARGLQSVLLVPEQEAVQAERLTLKKLPPSAQLTLEVTNFSRLYNRVCREYGGLCYSYMTVPIRHLMMWRSLRQSAPLLKTYRENALNDSAFEKTMLGTINELKSCGISITDIEKAVDECRDTDSVLCSRLEDIAVIYGTYDSLVSERYTDSADDLARLSSLLEEHTFFKGKNVYIDSFNSFTAIEHKIISQIFATAENTVISIPLPTPKYSDISTQSIEESLKILKKNANKFGSGHQDLCLEGAKQDCHYSLSYIAEKLWSMELPEEAPLAEGHVVLETCDTPYAEAEATASHILELVRNGARFRDMVIIVRDIKKYKGIIEPALETANIPFFLSDKTDLCSLAPIKLILSALRIKRYNWKKDDVISHIKTGLCDFSQRDADLFEEYINTWNISGSRFTDGDWSMNPDGYTQGISPRGKVILEIANRTRRELCQPLEELFTLLDAANNVTDMCKAIYDYTRKIGLEEKLLELSEREKEWNDKKSSEELASAYGIILKALADIAAAMPDTAVSIEELENILKIVFDQTEIGTIPTSIDQVTIGTAALFRASNPAYAFVLGLCEGEFPAGVDDTGIFTTADRDKLAEYGLYLEGSADTRASDELLYVKNALCAPYERLYMFTSRSGSKGEAKTPSLPFRRMEALFGDVTPKEYCGDNLYALCGSPQSAAAHLRNISDVGEKAAAVLAVSEHIPSVSTLSSANAAEPECRIEPEIIRNLIGDKIYVSPSSLEKFVMCPFSYYAGYMLALREPKKGSFQANNFGSFIHYVLEHMIKFAVPANRNDKRPSKEEIEKQVEKTVEEYIRLIAPDEALRTKRMTHLYGKLKKLSLLLIDNVTKEFEDSDFRPAFFELHINGKDGNPNSLSIPLSNGASVVLKGYVDRIDLWKDGEKVYVRIVDYKTGSKEFELEDVAHGINTQMLLYLFSVCRSPGTKLKESAELDGEALPIPSGIVYLSSAISKVNLKDYGTSEEEILQISEDKLSRSGILLNDERILRAMSNSGSKNILLGVTKNQDGTFDGKSLISFDDFNALYGEIKETLCHIGNKIYEGYADCKPIEYGDADPCKYCNVRPMCRRNEAK